MPGKTLSITEDALTLPGLIRLLIVPPEIEPRIVSSVSSIRRTVSGGTDYKRRHSVPSTDSHPVLTFTIEASIAILNWSERLRGSEIWERDFRIFRHLL